MSANTIPLLPSESVDAMSSLMNPWERLRSSSKRVLCNPVYIVAVSVCVIPLMAWNGAFGVRANVGGDVPGLFYLHPGLFLSHFSFIGSVQSSNSITSIKAGRASFVD